ncbi:ArsR family transcriptional regulator [Halonotius terrestris]|uniref:ArsR family transcriptional regulator n=1 Tax=Halonotius terrestris TaxID=2487750 RepID=A0A8J8PCJ1_9EURY|nr:winged helix-turn-helix domain-containing protein [Halonotius terrestris]TQQ81328.1 ArsR family transcriptional regulator [Halonotius terrestris]
MEAVLWQVLAGTRGGPNRARILKSLDDRPRNANQLAEELGLAYQTIRHHLDVLEDNDVLKSTDEEYGTIYLPSDRTRQHWETVETIIEQVDIQ